ncbi:hypothetical protein LHYA1_G004602 [Lachnellula hyalina]|uniref:Aminoglycoside phosphotransferase domain-containing protein n=1 Tax=Lachnellula hyalina TaxID=1316788 RepID=A0A8H8R0F0_9HELO|nr:uncharacterized protein LHYA1_G004602 [Lachnellula hyalina]TVY25786.1 hypothetical protein LHYA1_G004602 [Lachnellula hyalina]
MSSISLPYYADPRELPCSIPTRDQIESSNNVLVNQSSRKVVVVGEHFIVKYGGAIDLFEGENMVYLYENSIPVPKIYALFEEDSVKYIVMERISGDNLLTLWPALSQSQKEIITNKLKVILNNLRSLPSPGGFCSIGNRPLEDGIFWMGNSKLQINGPFTSETELNEAIVKKFISHELSEHKAAFYKRAFPYVLQGHPPVFTHGDIQRKNIMISKMAVEDGENNRDVEGSLEVVVVDWETSGWYPSYWEYSKAMFACGRWYDDWNFWVGKIMDEHFTEWAWVDMVMRECWS